MDWRRVVVSTLLLAVCTGCPHTWGHGGSIDRAVAKDIQENLRRQKQACALSEVEWVERCEDPADWEYFDCPRECR